MFTALPLTSWVALVKSYPFLEPLLYHLLLSILTGGSLASGLFLNLCLSGTDLRALGTGSVCTVERT